MILLEVDANLYKNQELPSDWKLIDEETAQWVSDDEKEAIKSVEKAFGIPASSDGICFIFVKEGKNFFIEGSDVDLFLADGFDFED